MNLKKVQIEFDEAEVQRILSIGWDENPGDALAFVKEILCKRVKKALQPH